MSYYPTPGAPYVPQQTAAPTQQYVPIEQYNALVHRLDELEKWQKSFSKPTATAKKGE